MSSPQVEVRRSARRKRTVSAYRREGRVVVLIPARFTRAEEAEWVARMIADLERREQRTRRGRSDADLLRRATRLSEQFLDGRARPVSVRWVTNMTARWGSCTVADATVRLSHRLREMPDYVIDCVLLHELAHLLVPGHGAEFWELADRHPRAERAKGYLEGVAQAAGLDLSPEADSAAAG